MDNIIWSGRPSQWLNFKWFLACALLFWLVVPIIVAWWRWLVIRNTRYELTTQRLFTYHGVLNKEIDELELYRVKDFSQKSPFFLRLVGLGVVQVETTDRTDPSVTINGIKDASEVRQLLRTNVEACRRKTNVREWTN
ncbi:hypothetical protein CJU79_23045 [Pseudomonas fragi]|uniref:PH domain-containing protein n=1 Tax=Pseudomonas fragi TaxID=296 RepID=UPI000BA22473|nr:PH domain-containing protein [Pseudomonas fragi]PAA33108.1 hypothetical protein CJU79_23045 [Pseudomonas fragi]